MNWRDTFDSGGAAPEGCREIFGLPCGPDDAAVRLLPVPFDATTSYGAGTALGPEAVRAASLQLDLEDSWMGPVWTRGICMDEADAETAALSASARDDAGPIIEKGAAGTDDAERIRRIDDAGEHIRHAVSAWTRDVLRAGKTPGLVGGEHSVSLGAIQACSSDVQIGVLQIDAHMDLRPAYQGFRYSHATVMYNVLASCPGVTRLVQVGIRDHSAEEWSIAGSHEDRVRIHRMSSISSRLFAGETWKVQCERIVADLPDRVYVSFDIDGLDPALCPHTGTPVPGGLDYNQAGMLLRTLRDSGRDVVGFDLVEVAPGPDEWDANVGARVLYMLCGL